MQIKNPAPQASNPYQGASGSRKHRGRGTVFMALVYLLMIFAVLNVFHKPVKDVTGYDVDLIKQLTEDENEATRIEELSRQEAREDIAMFNLADSSGDNSHDAVVQTASMKAVESYLSEQSHHVLAQDLFGCQERTNAQADSTIQHALEGDWCPELKDRRYMVATVDCNSGRSIMSFLRTMAWAVVTDRTLLVQTITEECHEAKGADAECPRDKCDGLYDIDPTLPRYQYWKKQLGLPKAETISYKDLDAQDEKLLVKLSKTRALSRTYLEDIDSIETAEKLLEHEDFLYGMLFDMSLQVASAIQTEVDDKYNTNNRNEFTALAQTSAADEDALKDCALSFDSDGIPCTIFVVGDGNVDKDTAQDCEIKTLPTSTSVEVARALAIASEFIRDSAAMIESTKAVVPELMCQIASYHVAIEEQVMDMETCSYAIEGEETKEVEEEIVYEKPASEPNGDSGEEADSEDGDSDEADSEDGDSDDEADSEDGDSDDEADSEDGDSDDEADSEDGDSDDEADSEDGDSDDEADSEDGDSDDEADSEDGDSDEKKDSNDRGSNNSAASNDADADVTKKSAEDADSGDNESGDRSGQSSVKGSDKSDGTADQKESDGGSNKSDASIRQKKPKRKKTKAKKKPKNKDEGIDTDKASGKTTKHDIDPSEGSGDNSKAKSDDGDGNSGDRVTVDTDNSDDVGSTKASPDSDDEDSENQPSADSGNTDDTDQDEERNEDGSDESDEGNDDASDDEDEPSVDAATSGDDDNDSEEADSQGSVDDVTEVE